MRHSKLVQVFTLFSFVMLISAFLLYRSGVFNIKHTVNPNIAKKTQDSSVTNHKVAITDSQPLRLYSSKSMPMLVSTPYSEDNKEKLRLSSSKSEVIGEPTILKLDTNTKLLRLYSSKSLILTIPDELKLDSAFIKLISPKQATKSDSTKVRKKGIPVLKNAVFIDGLIADTTKKRK